MVDPAVGAGETTVPLPVLPDPLPLPLPDPPPVEEPPDGDALPAPPAAPPDGEALPAPAPPVGEALPAPPPTAVLAFPAALDGTAMRVDEASPEPEPAPTPPAPASAASVGVKVPPLATMELGAASVAEATSFAEVAGVVVSTDGQERSNSGVVLSVVPTTPKLGLGVLG